MTKCNIDFSSQRGGAGIKVLLVFVVLALAANAGYNYIPVAYNGASLKQEMDTAVVKGLAAAGNIQPVNTVTAHVQKAIRDYNIPPDAVVKISPAGGGAITAHVTYQQEVNLLPFGLYKHTYSFDHTARPVGFLTKP